jgi:hypothetical protein
MRTLLLEARAQLEREFGELFESGVELPPGLKENVEAAIDRIGTSLKRLQRGDALVGTELSVLCGGGDDGDDAARERLLDALLLDAEVDSDFRGPGLLLHRARRPRSAGSAKLAALRRDVESKTSRESRAELNACTRVLRLAIALGRARLEQLQHRYERQPERLAFEVARRMRANQNPLRLIGEEMNEIVRAAALCLTEDEREPRDDD